MVADTIDDGRATSGKCEAKLGRDWCGTRAKRLASVMGVVDLPSGQRSVGSNNGDSSAGDGATGGVVGKGRTGGVIGCCCIRQI
jgi:hypothetical protein